VGTMAMEVDIPPSKPRSKGDDSAPSTDVAHDWVIGFNPAVPRRLDIDLAYTLEHDSVVCCVKFSADGKFLATGYNHCACIYDVETGKKIHTFADESRREGDLYIRSVCFSPDGKYLVTGAEDKTIKVWDIEQKVIRYDLQGHDLDIYSLDFSSNGQFIISGSGDRKVKVWNVETGKCVTTLGNEDVGPRDGVTSVAISPDCKLVAAGSLDRIVRLWDTETGYIRDRFEGHSDSVYSVAFSPDGKWLASGSLDKTLKLWDLAARARSRCRSTLSGHKDFVLSVAFSPDGNWLVSGSKDRAVQFWDPRTGTTHMRLHGHKNSVISVALTGPLDGSYGKFATGSGDNRARIWKYRVGNFERDAQP
jgi:glucose repression regulatory protein TUP1